MDATSPACQPQSHCHSCQRCERRRLRLNVHLRVKITSASSGFRCRDKALSRQYGLGLARHRAPRIWLLLHSLLHPLRKAHGQVSSTPRVCANSSAVCIRTLSVIHFLTLTVASKTGAQFPGGRTNYSPSSPLTRDLKRESPTIPPAPPTSKSWSETGKSWSEVAEVPPSRNTTLSFSSAGSRSRRPTFSQVVSLGHSTPEKKRISVEIFPSMRNQR